MKTDTDKRASRLKDIFGYCLWVLSLPAGLVVAAACYWFEHEGVILAVAIAGVLLFLWIRFVWTRVLRRKAMS